MKVIGIDPGLNGAVAVFEGPKLIGYSRTPTYLSGGRKLLNEHAMLSLLRGHKDADLAIMEQVQGFPKQAALSTFNFGASFGAWLAILASLDIRCQLLTPARWHRIVGIPKQGDPKAQAVAIAQRFCTELRLKKSDHDVADAILLALCGQLMFFDAQMETIRASAPQQPVTIT